MRVPWAPAHGSKLAGAQIQVTPQNSGITLVRRIILRTWRLVHGEWGVRNKARHGDTAEERAEKQKEQVLAELKMWYNRREAGELQLQEEKMYYSTFERHKEKEGNLFQIRAWLSNFGSILQNGYQDAIESRRTRRRR